MNIRAAKSSLRSAGQPLETGVPVAVTGASAQKPNSVIKHASITCTPEQRQTMISEAAYFMAEHRGFQSGQELPDWLFAESQIDAAIACGELPHVYKL
jgi:hypothetical protein